MTVTDLITASRDQYNATGDSFFTDTAMYNWIWEAAHQLATRAWMIERIYTTTTVAGQQSYPFPSNALAIKRITVNGKKIKNITMRQDDAITLSNQNVTSTGWPIYYTEFSNQIFLRPTPDSAYTMQIWAYSDHQQITTANSPLEIPVRFQFPMINYVLFRMFAKDKDIANAMLHKNEWKETLAEAQSYRAKMKRTDSFAVVQDESTLPVTILGEA